MNYEFILNVKEGDTLYVPITLKENGEIVSPELYTATAYVLGKTFICENITTETKIFHISAEENDFIDGEYTLYLVLERKTGQRKTVTGKLIVEKGKINGQY